MKAHITKEEQTLFLAKIFQKKIDEAMKNGIEIGAKSISKVIYDKVTNEAKSEAERIDDIKSFCENGLSNKTK